MATQVVMPKLSPTMEEGQLSKWLKKEGDEVSMGEPLAEIDTDKATMEMQALGTGVLRKILIQEGESAPLGQIIAIIGTPDEDISAIIEKAGSGQAAAATETKGEAEPAETGAQGETNDVPPASAQAPSSDAAGKAPQTTSGNGARAAENGDEKPSGGRLVVSPLAARMAAEAGIDLRSLSGSGPGGRIIKR
ncbi:MAG: biotin/lipoyl-containing protein, partial [Pyrinomonadaceae bacterium]